MEYLVCIALKSSYVWWVFHTLAFPLPLFRGKAGFYGAVSRVWSVKGLFWAH